MIESDSEYINDKLREFEKLLPLNDPRRINILNYYFKEEIYLPNEIKSLKIIDQAISKPQYIYNIVKTTRAGCTTNIIKGCLYKNKTILVVEPTNEIAYKTVHEIMDIYKNSTNDDSKIVRQIPSNRDGCSDIVRRLEENESLKLVPYIIAGKCKECNFNYKSYSLMQNYIPKATHEFCTIKTMMDEKEFMGDGYLPDILTITYDKLLTLSGGERSDFYKALIDNVDVIFFDELGSYITKSEQGLEIQHKEIIEKEEKIKKIIEMKKEVRVFAIKMKNISLRDRILKLLNEFITPFVDGIYNEVIDKDRYPRFINNPLNKENTRIKVKRGDIQVNEWVTKTEAIGTKAKEFYEDLEDLLLNDEERSRKAVLWLIELLQIMPFDKYVAFEQEFIDFDNNTETIHKILKITPLIDEMIKRLEPFMENKISFITDATMPAFTFDMFKKPVIDVYFGDPLNTNNQLMIMNDKRIKKTFSVIRWNKDLEFREDIINRIEKYLKYHGNNIVIWTPNKNIWREVQLMLQASGYPTCTHENEEEDHVLITYFGSVMTRGVKSDRRLQILLGKANKPKNSFKHIAYMQRIQWRFFSQRELEEMSNRINLSVDEFKNIIENWIKTENYGKFVVRKNKIPPELVNYFDYYSDAIQKERTYMDTWQAASRVKDSKGLNRSTLICLGWRNEEIWEMVKWGSNKSIKYIPYLENAQRVSASQRSLIPPPRVIELEDINDAAEWFAGGEIDDRLVGFDVDLQNGVFNMLIKGRKYVDSEEVWLELSKNLMIGETTENCKNGYLVGTIRAFKRFNDFGEEIDCKEINKGDFEFSFTDMDKKIKSTLTYEELETMSNILKIGYKVKKDKIVYRDVKRYLSNKDDEFIKLCLKKIATLNILKNSTWGIQLNENTGNYEIFKNKQDYLTTTQKLGLNTVDKSHFKDFEKKEILKFVQEWYEKSNELDLDVKEIHEYLFNIKLDIIKEKVKEIAKTGFENFGLDCGIVIQPSGRGEKIKIMRKVAKI